jgi:tRNA(Ile)-lysidine synthase
MAAAEAAERFRADLERIAGTVPARIGVAVSGGPDSLALLLLAAAAYPGRVEAATVDHRLRPESGEEAAHVACICAERGIPHSTLPVHWPAPPVANVPARARGERYRALLKWADERRLVWLATAHHLDDQAETVLMRLARGAGVGGLAGVHPLGHVIEDHVAAGVIRPLLGWRKRELVEIVEAAGLRPVDDPTNDSDALDRTHVRRLLAANPLLDPQRLAQSAANLADAEAALAWMVERLYFKGAAEQGDALTIEMEPELPTEFRRRLLLRGLGHFIETDLLPGPKVMRLLAALDEGRVGTLAGVKVSPGPTWRFERAPPHRGADKAAQR